jgi:hypothetical protein
MDRNKTVWESVIHVGEISGANHIFSGNVKTTLNNTIKSLWKNLKRCIFLIYPYMYFVAKVEMQIRYIKIQMKKANSSAYALQYTCPKFLSCSAFEIGHFCMNFSTLSLHLNFCNNL